MEPKDEIKQKLDVAEVIREYLELKPAGGGSFKALCPFHQEKTPSFHISTEKQIWHCFGCGEGGDIFAFVMKMEGLDFPEALRQLGKKAGVEIKRFSTEQSQEKYRLAEINRLAGAFYRKVLEDAPRAQVARDYLEKRGIDAALRETFGIGFALDAWDTLALFLEKRGFASHECQKAGLLLSRKTGPGMIDRFRNRVMIPLCDPHGNVMGFTGRVLPGADDQGPKYMNSPETPLYHKSDVLFGLDLAKKAIREQGTAIIVEGNLDVVASHKAGVHHVVASSGTALTESQLNQLKRLTTTIIFSFDADAAGLEAARRGMRLARSLGLDVRVAVLPPSYKDPDELVQKEPDRWREVVQKTVPSMQFLIEKMTQGKDLRQVDDKRAVAAALLPELMDLQDVVEREHWLRIIADLLQTDMDVLRSSLKPTVSPVSSIQQKSPGVEKKTFSKEEKASMLLIGCGVQDPAWMDHMITLLDPEELVPKEAQTLYKILANSYHKTQPLAQQSFFERLREELGQTAEGKDLIPLLDASTISAEQFLHTLSPQQAQAQLDLLVHMLHEFYHKMQTRVFVAKLRQAEQAGDTTRVEEILRQFPEA